MQSLASFLINLEGSDDRLASAQAALKAEGITFARISATDGRGKAANAFSDYDSTGTRRLMGRDLTGGEVGCFLSHVKAAQAFLTNGAKFGLVLEDDMQPVPGGIARVLRFIEDQTEPNWHLMHLGATGLKYQTRLSDGVFKTPYFPMRTTALLWSQEGARAFLGTALPITCPIDIHLRQWVLKTNKGLTLDPAPFDIRETQSEIGAAAGIGKRGAESRQMSYQVKRLRRMMREKVRAFVLSRVNAR